jgi:hypothetical protein
MKMMLALRTTRLETIKMKKYFAFLHCRSKWSNFHMGSILSELRECIDDVEDCVQKHLLTIEALLEVIENNSSVGQF